MVMARLGILLKSMFKGQLAAFHQPLSKAPWFGLSFVVLLIDQLTKNWASAVLTYAEPLTFLPHFSFTLLHNYGAAFSFLSDQDGWQRLFFAVIAFSVSLCLAVWILRLKVDKKIEVAGLSLVLGGAVGNLWDRIYLGYVVDFIDWFYYSSTNDCLSFFYSIFSTQSCHWPAFNIADSAIMLGAGLLIFDMFLGGKKPH